MNDGSVCCVCNCVCVGTLLTLSQDHHSYHVAFCVMITYVSTKWVLAVGVSCNGSHGWKWRIREIKEKEGKKREVEKMNEGHVSVYCVQCVWLQD